MSRLTPKTETLRALFARSGNQCAFPGCTQPLINNKNKFIGQVCHIEAALAGGERFNSTSNDEYRRSYENLLILCYPHHIETDEIGEYSTERLLQIKIEHEQLFLKSNFKIDESELSKLAYEMDKYWSDLERLNKIDHIHAESGLAVEVNGDSSFADVILSAYDAVKGLEYLLLFLFQRDQELQNDLANILVKKGLSSDLFEDIPYSENPFVNRNWEAHSLGTPNWLQRIRIDLAHIEVKYLEEYLKTHHDDLKAKYCFDKAKEVLTQYAKTAVHYD